MVYYRPIFVRLVFLVNLPTPRKYFNNEHFQSTVISFPVLEQIFSISAMLVFYWYIICVYISKLSFQFYSLFQSQILYLKTQFFFACQLLLLISQWLFLYCVFHCNDAHFGPNAGVIFTTVAKQLIFDHVTKCTNPNQFIIFKNLPPSFLFLPYRTLHNATSAFMKIL